VVVSEALHKNNNPNRNIFIIIISVFSVLLEKMKTCGVANR
jgi:hypothetical protein